LGLGLAAMMSVVSEYFFGQNRTLVGT